MDSLSGLRVAIYARHSTHMQAGSAEDQIARCITLVEHQGGQVGGIYRDEARTGATTAHRDGINRLVDDAAHERFEAVLFEDLSRLSRDIADTAAVFRDLTYAGITLHSVTEGRISALHIGLKGTMNQLFLTDLRDKSRRGLRASVKRGRVLNYPYGYEKIPMFDESGKQVPGQARIKAAEAAVVRRIFEECAEGKPIAEIVGGLNRDGIPSPKGGKWTRISLYGARYRRDGILRRPLYVGEYVWGRASYPTDPRTGKQTRQPRPRTDWETMEVPHLAIIDRELWEKVQDVLAQGTARRPLPRNRPPRRPPPPAGPKLHLTSRISRCIQCGGSLTPDRGGWIRCYRHDNQRTCDQAFRMPRHSVVRRVLRVLRMRLATRRHWLRDFIREEHEKRRANNTINAVTREEAEAAIALRRRKIANLLDLIEDGTGGDETRVRIRSHEKRLRGDIRMLEDLAASTPRVAERDLAAVADLARARLLAAIDRLLTVDINDAEAIGLMRQSLVRIDAGYRGPGRTRLRADPHLDPAAVYELGLNRADAHQTETTAEAA